MIRYLIPAITSGTAQVLVTQDSNYSISYSVSICNKANVSIAISIHAPAWGATTVFDVAAILLQPLSENAEMFIICTGRMRRALIIGLFHNVYIATITTATVSVDELYRKNLRDVNYLLLFNNPSFQRLIDNDT